MMLQFAKKMSFVTAKENTFFTALKTRLTLIVVNCPLLPLSLCSLVKVGARGKLLSWGSVVGLQRNEGMSLEHECQPQPQISTIVNLIWR